MYRSVTLIGHIYQIAGESGNVSANRAYLLVVLSVFGSTRRRASTVAPLDLDSGKILCLHVEVFLRVGTIRHPGARLNQIGGDSDAFNGWCAEYIHLLRERTFP